MGETNHTILVYRYYAKTRGKHHSASKPWYILIHHHSYFSDITIIYHRHRCCWGRINIVEHKNRQFKYK